MSVATWSLRDRAVCRLPPAGPAISIRRRSIAMWMSSSPGRNSNVPSANSAATRRGRRRSPSRSSSARIPVGQHRRVRPRLGDVVTRQAPVEADRGVEALEDRVGRIAKASHSRQFRAASTAGIVPAGGHLCRPGPTAPARAGRGSVPQPDEGARLRGYRRPRARARSTAARGRSRSAPARSARSRSRPTAGSRGEGGSRTPACRHAVQASRQGSGADEPARASAIALIPHLLRARGKTLVYRPPAATARIRRSRQLAQGGAYPVDLFLTHGIEERQRQRAGRELARRPGIRRRGIRTGRGRTAVGGCRAGRPWTGCPRPPAGPTTASRSTPLRQLDGEYEPAAAHPRPTLAGSTKPSMPSRRSR